MIEADKARKLTQQFKLVEGKKVLEFSIPIEYLTENREYGHLILAGCFEDFKMLAKRQFVQIIEEKNKKTGIIRPNMAVH